VTAEKAPCLAPNRHLIATASKKLPEYFLAAVRTNATRACRLGARPRRVPISFANDADKLLERVEVGLPLASFALPHDARAVVSGWLSQPWDIRPARKLNTLTAVRTSSTKAVR
jgi:hypothetical protein